MKLGKYITNLGVISALLGAFGVLKQTKQMPSDWRRYIVWIVWVLGLVLTVAGVAKDAEEQKALEEF